MEWSPLYLSFKLALVTTFVLTGIGIPFSYWLSYRNFKGKPVIEALVSMPLVLPPTVLGFYLLLLLSPSGFLGGILEKWFDIHLLFSFSGLVIGSFIYSFPFMVQPLQAGFSKVPRAYREASLLMGKSKITTLFKVILPNMKPALLTGIILTFAHTLGEFGVVLMIGGNIPDKTKVASIAIYENVEALQYHQAHWYALVLLICSFCMVFPVYLFNYKQENRNK